MTWTQIAWAFFAVQVLCGLLLVAMGIKIASIRKKEQGR